MPKLSLGRQCTCRSSWGNLRQGEKVILLIDDENHVIDVAAPEAMKG